MAIEKRVIRERSKRIGQHLLETGFVPGQLWPKSRPKGLKSFSPILRVPVQKWKKEDMERLSVWDVDGAVRPLIIRLNNLLWRREALNQEWLTVDVKRKDELEKRVEKLDSKVLESQGAFEKVFPVYERRVRELANQWTRGQVFSFRGREKYAARMMYVVASTLEALGMSNPDLLERMGGLRGSPKQAEGWLRDAAILKGVAIQILAARGETRPRRHP